MMQYVCISVEKHNNKSLRKLFRIALAFSKATGFSIFEMQLSMITKSFLKDLECKNFFIYRTPQSPWPIKTSPDTMRIPIIGVKGIINKEAISFLAEKNIADNIGSCILIIMLREGSKKETPDYFLSNKLYRGKKNWVSLSTDYSLHCSIRISKLKKLYALVSKEQPIKILFDPVENVLYLSKKRSELPHLKEFCSIKKFISAKRITTIQVSNFTRNELAKIGKRNFEKTILQLLKEHDAK